jgi:RNA polymerase sigma-70 factor (ECF subfamily)
MEEFVGLSYNDVRRLCAHLVDEASANDLAQEAYLRIVRGLPRFRADSSARTWMLSIAHHVCMDDLRSRTRSRRLGARLPVEAAGRAVEPDHSESVCLADLLARLSPERRAAFVLSQIFGLSYADVAAILGCAPGTVASRVARARSTLVADVAAGETSKSDQA